MFSAAQVRQVLSPYGADLTPDQVQAVGEYSRLLLLWNQKVNLTRIIRPEQILARHFGESFFAAENAGIAGGRLADVGTGAGFPGLALKIIRPSLLVTLLEPNSKKVAFLAEVTRVLGLAGVTILRARTEIVSPADIQANHITARAVGDLNGLLRWGHSALTESGSMVLWLGADDAELAARLPGWSWREPIRIPNSERSFLLVGSRID